jgi:outer membrane protein assembly factor BamB
LGALAGRIQGGIRRVTSANRSKKKVVVNENTDWPQFRGPTRDGIVKWLPEQLPQELKPVWQVDLPNGGIGGVAANGQYVVVGSRDLADQQDLFECYSSSGRLLWGQMTPARGKLDYGNSPRSTPLIADDLVFTIGAFGDVQALDIETGARFWHRRLVEDLAGKRPEWGFTASPILIDEQLIVQPGGTTNSLAALDSISGEILWSTAGEKAVYASLVLQPTSASGLVGLDSQGVCGWSRSGQLLWRRKPAVDGDFGVPTPVITAHGMIVTSENNGTRLYALDSLGEPSAEPIATNLQVSPDSHTPVAVGNRVVIADNHLYCFDLANGLKQIWRVRDHDLRGYASVIASDSRVLVLTENATLMLFDLQSGDILGRMKLSKVPLRVLAHPALVGNRLYARIDRQLMCIEL